MLSIKNLHATVDGKEILKGISLEVREGQIVSLLGANGAGKTTVLKTISGAMEPQKGSVILEGEPIHSKDPDEVARIGVAHVPEGREVFPFLSVAENLQVGAFSARDNAQRLLLTLDDGLPGRVRIYEVPGDGATYRVRVGPLSTSETPALRQQLDTLGITEAIVVFEERL